jgi:hypothetical protein
MPESLQQSEVPCRRLLAQFVRDRTTASWLSIRGSSQRNHDLSSSVQGVVFLGISLFVTEFLLLRCLAVRFVQIFIESQIWDAHSDLEKSLRYSCGKTDKPAAALLKDLKQRGLLDSTLVIWGGEFGRMPLSQVRDNKVSAGRDHNPSGFSIWMAGGGVKGGMALGATDELGHKALENHVSVHDFHATLLHLLGMNYRDLVYQRHGLNERLTDQFPDRVVSEILA